MEKTKLIDSQSVDTIAAISTSMGEAGIGIVRMSGPQAFSITESLFHPVDGKKYEKGMNRRLRYGMIHDGEKDVDEVLVSFMKGPHTYSGEDITEINAHGGHISVRRILSLCLAAGARLADPGEFTRRAFLNGRIDLIQAESVLDIIDADGEAAQQMAVDRLRGKATDKIHQFKSSLLHLLSHIEYVINFMEDEVEDPSVQPMIAEGEALLTSLAELHAASKRGRIVRTGIQTAIVGQPNVGKSSLLNALLQEERAIVTEIPGTTRDAIEETLRLDDLTLRLIDTAGIRETEDVVEAMGVAISRKHLEEADLVLLLVDGSAPLSTEDNVLLDLIDGRPAIVVVNKEDLGLNPSIANSLSSKGPGARHDLPWVAISAKNGTGLTALSEAVHAIVSPDEIPDDAPALATVRQIDLLEKAQRSLASGVSAMKEGITLDALEVDIRQSYRYLAEITGESIEEDVLDQIFKDFCVGK